ncbi:DUF4189 domain-containing protein [Nocardia uniformis]|uniref:DUF4189 domain-containing protein n=1 Tax=Nocardia uniformis TaxID=53432 RepID=A0A849BNY2_9NOCA|nr:DUF4189 domain-containing protein [Nocardia uniformis]NNH68293.1 DUF4189 domain-containing protein [Nocardia uniformis]
MSLLRKAGIGFAGSSLAALSVVAAGPAAAVESGYTVHGGFVATGGDLYGAMAVSQSVGKVTYALNYTDWNGADAAAVEACAAGDCRIVVHFSNACGAVARSDDGRFAGGWGPTKVEAESAAVSALGSQGPNLGSSQAGGKVVMAECTENAR